MWLHEAECKDVVELAWSMPHTSSDVPTTQDRIKSCQQQLQWWNRNVFKRVDKQLKEKQDKLQYLESLDTLHEFAEDIHLLHKEINDLLDKENDMWWQRSRSLWMQQGDRNIKFFHSTASQRQRKNTIQGFLDDQGVWQSIEEGTKRTILEYYTSIFTSNRPTQFTAVEQVLEPKVIGEMNMVLTREFQPDEVWRALQQMHPMKSPGPDGMPLSSTKNFGILLGQILLNVY